MDWGGIITYLVVTTQQLRGIMSVGEDNEEVEELSGENKFGEE